MKKLTIRTHLWNGDTSFMPPVGAPGSAGFDGSARAILDRGNLNLKGQWYSDPLFDFQSIENVPAGFRGKVGINDKTGDCFYTLSPGDEVVVALGFFFEIPEGWQVEIHPRSGMQLKKRVELPGISTIDAGYCAEMTALLKNQHPRDPFFIERGMRIAQFKFKEVPVIQLEDASGQKLVYNGRPGGFGSTGMKALPLVQTGLPLGDIRRGSEKRSKKKQG